MERPRVRLLPYAVGDGPHQMACDETMMETAGQGVASLRFYGWSPATLSLGYFQAADARLADPRLANLAWVRRPSGGEALVHDRELTYALALPAGAPWQRRGESWVQRFHLSLRDALGDLGVPTTLCPAEGERRLGDFLCFLHQTPDDLLIGAHKIVGSAQRRPQRALMQHGSILIAQSAHTPSLPGISELTGRQVSVEEMQRALCDRLTTACPWHIGEGDWTAAERKRVEELVGCRYTGAAWNGRR